MTSSSGERVEQYNSVTRDSSVERPQVQVVSSNPLDNLDFSSQEFRAGVDNLAASLKVLSFQVHHTCKGLTLESHYHSSN